MPDLVTGVILQRSGPNFILKQSFKYCFTNQQQNKKQSTCYLLAQVYTFIFPLNCTSNWYLIVQHLLLICYYFLMLYLFFHFIYYNSGVVYFSLNQSLFIHLDFDFKQSFYNVYVVVLLSGLYLAKQRFKVHMLYFIFKRGPRMILFGENRLKHSTRNI